MLSVVWMATSLQVLSAVKDVPGMLQGSEAAAVAAGGPSKLEGGKQRFGDADAGVPEHVEVFDIGAKCPPGMEASGGPVVECFETMRGAFRKSNGEFCYDTVKCPGVVHALGGKRRSGVQGLNMRREDVRELFTKLVPQYDALQIRKRAAFGLQHLLLPLLPLDSPVVLDRMRQQGSAYRPFGGTLIRVPERYGKARYYVLPLRGAPEAPDLSLAADDMPFVEYLPLFPRSSRGTAAMRVQRWLQSALSEVFDALEYWQGMAMGRGSVCEEYYIRLYRLLGLLPPVDAAGTTVFTNITAKAGKVAGLVNNTAVPHQALSLADVKSALDVPTVGSAAASSTMTGAAGRRSNVVSAVAYSAAVAGAAGPAGARVPDAPPLEVAKKVQSKAATGMGTSAEYEAGDVLGLYLAHVLYGDAKDQAGTASGVLSNGAAPTAVWDSWRLFGWRLGRDSDYARYVQPFGMDMRQMDLGRMAVTPRSVVYVTKPVPEAEYAVIPHHILSLSSAEENVLRGRIQQLAMRNATREYVEEFMNVLEEYPELEKAMRGSVGGVGGGKTYVLPVALTPSDLKSSSREELAEGGISHMARCYEAVQLDAGEAGKAKCATTPGCEAVAYTAKAPRGSGRKDRTQYHCVPAWLMNVGFREDKEGLLDREDSSLSALLRRFGGFMEARNRPKLKTRSAILGQEV